MGKTFFVYTMTNPRKTVLYTGVTNNLPRRVHEHIELIKSMNPTWRDLSADL